MKTAIITRQSDGAQIARARIARSMWSRFWGLMLKRSLPEDDALLIDPCGSVHMFFMRFALDVVFLDRENRVVKVARGLKPWRISLAKGAKRVIEMPPGAASAVNPGDQLSIDEE